MKKCPFCKADLAENANFCVYCMTSLEEKALITTKKKKNKWWLYILAAIFVLALIGCLVWVIAKINNFDKTMGPSYTTVSSSTHHADDNVPTFATTTSNQSGLSSTLDQTPPSTKESTNEETITTTIKDDHIPTSSTTSGTSTTTTNATTAKTTTTTKITTTSYPVFSTTTTKAPIVIEYEYRDATAAECFPSGYGPGSLSSPTVVITGIKTISPTGIYVVPEYIDGKKVGAIMQEAFCNPYVCLTVKTVILPSTVRSIWPTAFRDCYNMTDLYTTAPKIHIYEGAFANVSNRTGTLTIHCAYDCITYDYYLYRNIAYKYDALYEEWNG